jgi:hypothetical protein
MEVFYHYDVKLLNFYPVEVIRAYVDRIMNTHSNWALKLFADRFNIPLEKIKDFFQCLYDRGVLQQAHLKQISLWHTALYPNTVRGALAVQF